VAAEFTITKLEDMHLSETNPIGADLCMGVYMISCVWVFSSVIYLLRKLNRTTISFCDKYPAFGKWLVLVFPESEGSTQLIVDDRATWALFFFLGIIAALVGYRFLFRSTGTTDPNWTTTFGIAVRSEAFSQDRPI
jgi:hypothetical protein